MPRRYYDANLWTDYRLPLLARVGAAYEGERLHVGADLQVSLWQDGYALVRGNGGADVVQPRSKDGSPLGPPFSLPEPTRRDTVFNGSLGAQLDLSGKTSFLGGFFTDFSAIRRDLIVDRLHPRVDRLGVTVGVARRRAHATTYVTLVVTGGRGDAYTLAGARPSYETVAAYLNVGGSSVLDDLKPRQGDDQPTGRPLWTRWWFWTALGAAAAGGALVTVAAATRTIDLPASDLGSQKAPP
jgi:hypothetical protein